MRSRRKTPPQSTLLVLRCTASGQRLPTQMKAYSASQRFGEACRLKRAMRWARLNFANGYAQRLDCSAHSLCRAAADLIKLTLQLSVVVLSTSGSWWRWW